MGASGGNRGKGACAQYVDPAWSSRDARVFCGYSQRLQCVPEAHLPFQLRPPNGVGILGGRTSVPASTSLHTLVTVLALCPDSGPADPAPSSSHLGQGQQRITDPWGPVSSQLECASRWDGLRKLPFSGKRRQIFL